MMQHKPHTHTHTHTFVCIVYLCVHGNSHQLLLSIGGSITRERMCKRARVEERERIANYCNYSQGNCAGGWLSFIPYKNADKPACLPVIRTEIRWRRKQERGRGIRLLLCCDDDSPE